MAVGTRGGIRGGIVQEGFLEASVVGDDVQKGPGGEKHGGGGCWPSLRWTVPAGAGGHKARKGVWG